MYCKCVGIRHHRRIAIWLFCCRTIRFGNLDAIDIYLLHYFCWLFVFSFRSLSSVYEESKCLHVWRIGPTPCAFPPTDSNVPYLRGLGDTAVDFDIAPPRLIAAENVDGNSTVVRWTEWIFLRANSIVNFSLFFHFRMKRRPEQRRVLNGRWLCWEEMAIFMLSWSASERKSSFPEISKKMREMKVTFSVVFQTKNSRTAFDVSTNERQLRCRCMFVGRFSIKSTDDCVRWANGKAISRFAIGTQFRWIGQCEQRNTIGIFQEISSFFFIYFQSFNEIDSSIKIEPCEWTVNILETVELELGLADAKQSKSNDCAIHLKADINNDCRYFAYHNTGLHAVSIEFIPELERYFSDTGKLVNSHEKFKNRILCFSLFCRQSIRWTIPG